MLSRPGREVMGFRFRRSVKVFPGVRVNFSGSGVSTSVGSRGTSVTIGKRGTYLNLGVPGTGVSFRQRIDDQASRDVIQTPSSQMSAWGPPVSPEMIPTQTEPGSIPLPGEIRSADTQNLTSLSLKGLRDLLEEAYTELVRLQAEIPNADAELGRTKMRALRWQRGLFKHIRKKKFASILSEYQTSKTGREDLDKEIEKCRVALEVEMEAPMDSTYEAMVAAFRTLASCEKTWDTTSRMAVNQIRQRSTATSEIMRTPVAIDCSASKILSPSRQAMHLQNANGADIFILPGLLLMFGGDSDFALIRLRDVELTYVDTRFIEDDVVPGDTQVVGETWTKVNKDGSPDRRFLNNKRLPIVNYGTLAFKSPAGLNEEFLFSSAMKARTFSDALAAHQATLPN